MGEAEDNVLWGSTVGPERQQIMQKAGLQAIHRLLVDDTVDLLCFPKRPNGTSMLLMQTQSFLTRLLKSHLSLQNSTASDVAAAQRDLQMLSLEQLLRLRCENLDAKFSGTQQSSHASFLKVLDDCVTAKLSRRLFEGVEGATKPTDAEATNFALAATLVYGVHEKLSTPQSDQWFVSKGSCRWYLEVSKCRLSSAQPDGPVYCYTVAKSTHGSLNWEISLVHNAERWATQQGNQLSQVASTPRSTPASTSNIRPPEASPQVPKIQLAKATLESPDCRTIATSSPLSESVRGTGHRGGSRGTSDEESNSAKRRVEEESTQNLQAAREELSAAALREDDRQRLEAAEHLVKELREDQQAAVRGEEEPHVLHEEKVKAEGEAQQLREDARELREEHVALRQEKQTLLAQMADEKAAAKQKAEEEAAAQQQAEEEEEETKRKAAEEAKQKAEATAEQKAEEEAAARQKAQEEATRRAEEEEAAKKKAEEEATAMQKAEKESAARQKAQEENNRNAENEEATAMQKAEKESAARQKAQEENNRNAENEEAFRKKAAEVEEAKRKAEEEAAAKKKAEGEATDKQQAEEEEAANQKAQGEAETQADDEDTLREKAVDEAAAEQEGVKEATQNVENKAAAEKAEEEAIAKNEAEEETLALKNTQEEEKRKLEAEAAAKMKAEEEATNKQTAEEEDTAKQKAQDGARRKTGDAQEADSQSAPLDAKAQAPSNQTNSELEPATNTSEANLPTNRSLIANTADLEVPLLASHTGLSDEKQEKQVARKPRFGTVAGLVLLIAAVVCLRVATVFAPASFTRTSTPEQVPATTAAPMMDHVCTKKQKRRHKCSHP